MNPEPPGSAGGLCEDQAGRTDGGMRRETGVAHIEWCGAKTFGHRWSCQRFRYLRGKEARDNEGQGEGTATVRGTMSSD